MTVRPDFLFPAGAAEGSDARRELSAVLSGLYDVPLKSASLVLDVGANTGAFSVWAAHRWPGCRVLAFEPHPGAAERLRRNTAHMPVTVYQVAVGREAGEGALFEGKWTWGESSLYELGEQTKRTFGVKVETLDSLVLPVQRTHLVLKIDTEGAELDVLAGCSFLGAADALLVEWHRTADIEPIKRIARSAGLWTWKEEPMAGRTDRGVLKFLRGLQP